MEIDTRRYNTRLIIDSDNILRVNYNGTWKQFSTIPPLKSFEILNESIIGVTVTNDLIRAYWIDNELMIDNSFSSDLKIAEITVMESKNRDPLFLSSALILLEVNGDVRYSTSDLIIDEQVMASDISHIYPLNLYLRCQSNICLLIDNNRRVRAIDVDSNYNVIQHLFNLDSLDNVIAIRDRMIVTQDNTAYQFKMKRNQCDCSSGQLTVNPITVPFKVTDCILIDYMKFGEDEKNVVILLDDKGDLYNGVTKIDLGSKKFKRILYVEDQQNPTLEDIDGHLFYLADYEQGELIKIDIPILL